MPTLSSHEVDSLLSKLCIDLGFCLPPTSQRDLAHSPPTSVLEFVDAVFRAEELDPDTADRRLFRQVRDLLQDAFDRHETTVERSERSGT